MKRKNLDINVAKQANISKISNLDNIGTSSRLFELLVDMTVGYTKLYGHREKVDTSFEITNEIFRLFLGMLTLNGCHKLPDRKMC